MSTTSKKAGCTPYICTHDNTFHCDDVTACYMLKSLTRFKDHEIFRSRDPEIWDGAEVVVDVGHVLDVPGLRLDHHQRSFNQTIKDYHPNLKTTNPNKPVRLSSAGLVYAIFGKDYLAKQLNLGETYAEIKEDAEKRKMIDCIYEVLYLGFMEEVDAIDNGVDIAAGENVHYNYHINSDISTRVSYFNPRGKDATGEERLSQFKKAMKYVGAELSERVKFYGEVWWPKRQSFKELVLNCKNFDPSGQILLVDTEHLAGWKTLLRDIEDELGIAGEIKFIVFNDGSGASPWRATGVPVEPKSFLCRMPLKEEWRGKRDGDLQEVSGVADATFVHMSGFTGGAMSEQGIKSLVRKTLGLD